MVSHKNYNLNVNEDFVILLTSKLITCFIEGFTCGMKACCPTTHLLVHVYIGFQILKVKCIQYGIGGRTTFEYARAMLFPKLSRADNNFMSG